MGLDASVMCNCFREGKTTSPPFPKEWLEVDEEGYLNLKKEYDSDENWGRHYEWEQSCCEHEGMAFASEYVSNWGGYRLFQEALGEVGWYHFPVLREQLPNVNGGLTPSMASAQALKELDHFAAGGQIGEKTVLVDTATGDGLYEHVAAYGGVFILSGVRGIKVGLSEFEFFAADGHSGKNVFRASRFRQFDKSGKQITADCAGLSWENLDTGEFFESGVAIPGKQIPWEAGKWENPGGECRFEYPTEFHIERRPRLVADFRFILKALRKVFAASVETGNPVRWC